MNKLKEAFKAGFQKEAQKPENSSSLPIDDDMSATNIAGAVAGAGSFLGGQATSIGMMLNAANSKGENIKPQVNELADYMGIDKSRIRYDNKHSLQGAGGAYVPKASASKSGLFPGLISQLDDVPDEARGTVNLGTESLGMAAHEMGHAKLHNKLGPTFTQLSLGVGGRVPMLTLPATAGAVLTDPDSAVGDAAAATPAVLGAPRLADEIGSSAIGLKNIAQSKGIGKALRSSPALAAGLATYGGVLGAPLAARGAHKYMSED